MSDPDPYKTTWIRIPDKHSYLHQLPGENEVVVLGPAKGLSEEPGEDELGADGEADLLLDEALAQHSPAHHPVSKVNLGHHSTRAVWRIRNVFIGIRIQSLIIYNGSFWILQKFKFILKCFQLSILQDMTATSFLT